MNKEHADLALAALEERHRVISPMYAELMGKFGELALNTVQIDSLRQDIEFVVANENLVFGFMGLLPRIGNDDRRFRVKTAQQARTIQSSVIWEHRPYHSVYSPETTIPYYIVGSKAIEPKARRRPNVALMLVTADGRGGRGWTGAETWTPELWAVQAAIADEPGWKGAETWTPELWAVQAALDSRLSQRFTDEQIERMFDPMTRELVVGPSAPGSLIFSRSSMPLFYSRRREKMNNEQKTAGRLVGGGGRVKGGPLIITGTRVPQLTDETLVEYDVLDHIGDLAEKFGKTKELRELIVKYSIEPKDPMDELLAAPDGKEG